MESIEDALVVCFMIVAGLLPSLLIAFIGWKLTRKLKNSFVRTVVRAAVLSLAFAPTVLGHAGPMFAIWAVFLAPGSYRLLYGLLPIVVTWFVVTIIALSWRRIRRRKVSPPMEGT